MVAEDELLLPLPPGLLETGKQILDEVEVATEPAGSRTVQEKVFKRLDLLDKAAEMLPPLELFSRNEDLEEIASTDLKCLLVPAFQGALTTKQVNPSKHLDHLQRAREHFINYLTQCHCYHVAEFELTKAKSNSAENHTANSSVAYPSLVAMASQRQGKEERYKQKKELEHRLSEMKSAVESGQAGQADDERVCKYYLLYLQRWIDIILEEIKSIDQEIKIMRERDSSRVKPFILTQNTAQVKVFGAGYPSLATMTVSDWYEQHRKYGELPDQGIGKATPDKFRKAAQQQEHQEEKEKEHDEQTLYRAREWDDWKDTHPWGYSSHQNMGCRVHTSPTKESQAVLPSLGSRFSCVQRRQRC
uniref:Immunoglobulin-binding protein 1-like n=1 Tax=Rhinopithecus roxellana TaxID=61622 RepID=A0A2K6RCB5_RHIRO